MTTTKTTVVDIRPLKTLSTKLLPPESMLRRVLLGEADAMPASDYASKLGTWLAILREETTR
ncbi:MAG: hypothetical protein JRN09_04195 [Nitrososphaerota archaeon]|nr:hypothetical protein [Nitrososphaerota archaeon]